MFRLKQNIRKLKTETDEEDNDEMVSIFRGFTVTI